MAFAFSSPWRLMSAFSQNRSGAEENADQPVTSQARDDPPGTMIEHEDRVEQFPANGSASSDGVPASDHTSPADRPPPESTGHVRQTLSGWRQFAQVAYRDPEHVAERLAFHGTRTLGEPSLAWARRVREERPDVPRAAIAEELRTQSAHVAAIDGTIAGTPFLFALVPGYLAYLQQETRMMLRTAALYDHDPREPEAAAEMLAMRGVHKTIDGARSAVTSVRHVPMPAKPNTRRPLRTWVHSVYMLLIFGGFLSAPSDKHKKTSHPRLKTALSLLLGATIWVITWVLPLTFMIAMAWGCNIHARRLGRRALIFHDNERDSAQAAIAAAKQHKDPGHYKRHIMPAGLLILSVAIPIGFIANVDRVRQSAGLTWLSGVGSLVALSLVIATAVAASRR